MRRIALTQGKYALVDNADFVWINQLKWCFSHGYAQTRSRGKKEYMHRVIMDNPIGKQIDHSNGDGLDNRRSNLRVCTVSDNQHNRGVNRNNKSGYKNIWYNPKKKLYQVSVMYKWKNYGGTYRYLRDAIYRRDILVEQLHGEFARTESR